MIQGGKDSKTEHTHKVELLLQQQDGKDGSKRGWQVSNTCREGNTTINKGLEPAWIQDFIGTNVLFFSYGEIVAYWLFLPWIESILLFFKTPTLYSFPPSFIDLSFHLPFPSRLFTLSMWSNKRLRKGEGAQRSVEWSELLLENRQPLTTYCRRHRRGYPQQHRTIVKACWLEQNRTTQKEQAGLVCSAYGKRHIKYAQKHWNRSLSSSVKCNLVQLSSSWQNWPHSQSQRGPDVSWRVRIWWQNKIFIAEGIHFTVFNIGKVHDTTPVSVPAICSPSMSCQKHARHFNIKHRSNSSRQQQVIRQTEAFSWNDPGNKQG